MNWNALAVYAVAACAIAACTSTSTSFGDGDDDEPGGAGGDDGSASGRSGSSGTAGATGGTGGTSASGGSATFGGAPGASGNGGSSAKGGATAAGAGNVANAGGASAGSPGNDGGTNGEAGASGRADDGGGAGATNATPCDPNPCLNDGICSAQGSGYRCECVNGESGKNCEVPCNLTDITVQFEDFGPAQLDKLETNGVEIVGSADLHFEDESGLAPGLGVLGGTADWLVDGSEFVSFRFARPARNVSYYVPGSTRNEGSNELWGESTIEAFDASGKSLGTEVATDNGQKNVSLFFDDEALSKFTVRLRDGDGITLGNVRFSICMTP